MNRFNIDSTTDSSEAMTQALGNKVAESKEAPEVSDDLEANESADSSKGISETAEASDPSEKTEDENQKPKKKNGFKKRIDKLNSRLSAKDAEVEYWKSQALKSPDQHSQEKIVESKAADGKPKSENFESHDAFVEALTDWKVDQKEALKEQKAKETELKASAQKENLTYQEREREFKKSHPDYADVVAEVDDIKLSAAVKRAVLKHGPELAYALSKDPARLRELCSMDPADAFEEIGVIRSALKSQSSDDQTKLEKTSKAPKPITPVGPKSTVVSKDPGEMDYQEYKRYREKQIREAKARG